MQRANVAYRADVDGLRAISILAVIGFHAFPTLVPGGFVGVDVFFVISGYLISNLIFTELKAGTFSFADFYTRRAKRILPALLVVLIVVWGVGWHCLIADDFARLGEEIAAGASYLSNIFFWNQLGYFDKMPAQKPLLHLWSLGVEEQFYLLFPFAVFAAWKRRFNLMLGISVIGILSFAANVALVYIDRRPAAFFLPHARFWELMVGSGLAYAAVFWKGTSSEWDRISRNLLAGLGLLFGDTTVRVTAYRWHGRCSPEPGGNVCMSASTCFGSRSELKQNATCGVDGSDMAGLRGRPGAWARRSARTNLTGSISAPPSRRWYISKLNSRRRASRRCRGG
jgi:peptidoglycan/LPS O-acetylase OafA/YrhL